MESGKRIAGVPKVVERQLPKLGLSLPVLLLSLKKPICSTYIVNKNPRGKISTSSLILTMNILALNISVYASPTSLTEQERLTKMQFEQQDKLTKTQFEQTSIFTRSVSKKILAMDLPAISYPPVKVHFRIHRNGNISDLRIIQSCKRSALDYAFLQAIQRSAPFDQIPASLQGEFDVNFQLGSPLPSGVGDKSTASEWQLIGTDPYPAQLLPRTNGSYGHSEPRMAGPAPTLAPRANSGCGQSYGGAPSMAPPAPTSAPRANSSWGSSYGGAPSPAPGLHY